MDKSKQLRAPSRLGSAEHPSRSRFAFSPWEEPEGRWQALFCPFKEMFGGQSVVFLFRATI